MRNWFSSLLFGCALVLLCLFPNEGKAATCSDYPSLLPLNVFPQDATSFFASEEHFYFATSSFISQFPLLIFLGSHLLMFNSMLKFSDSGSFDTGLSISLESGYISQYGLLFVRETTDSMSFYDKAGNMVGGSSVDSNSGARSFYHSPDSVFFCFLQSTDVVVVEILSGTVMMTISSSTGATLEDCAIRPGLNPEVLVIEMVALLSITISTYDVITGAQNKNTEISLNGFSLFAPTPKHGKWLNENIFVMIFGIESNPFAFDFSEFYPIKFEVSGSETGVSFSSVYPLKDKILGWNADTTRYIVMTSKLALHQKWIYNIPDNWSTEGMVAVTLKETHFAVYHESEGFFESWEIKPNKVILDLESQSTSNQVVKSRSFLETTTGTFDFYVTTFGTDLKVFNSASLRSLSHSTNCKWHSKHSHKIQDTWIYEDKVEKGVFMVTNSDETLNIYIDTDLCVALDFSSYSTPNEMMLEHSPILFIEQNNVILGLHSHLRSFNHLLNQQAINQLTETNWAMIVSIASPTAVQVVDLTYQNTHAILAVLDVISPKDFAWVYRQNYPLSISGSSLLVYEVADISLATGTLSNTFSIDSDPVRTLSKIRFLWNSNNVIVWGSDYSQINIMDYQLGLMATLVPFLPFASSSFSYIDSYVLSGEDKLIMTASFGLMSINTQTSCGFSFTSTSTCHTSCLTCSGPSKTSCLSCHPGLVYDSNMKMCRNKCNQASRVFVEFIFTCGFICPTAPTYSSGLSNICIPYQDDCENTSATPVFDDGTATCESVCPTGERFSLQRWFCTTDLFQENGSTQSYSNTLYWVGPEGCKQEGQFAQNLGCVSATDCVSLGLIDSGVSPYCESNCDSISARPDLFANYDANSAKCYSAYECPSDFPYAVNNVCTDVCPSGYISGEIGSVSMCFLSTSSDGCMGKGLLTDLESMVCTNKCPGTFPNTEIFTNICDSDSAASSLNCLDAEHQYLVGSCENCVFGTNLYNDLTTGQCVSIESCRNLGYQVRLSSRVCTAPICLGSSLNGVCCDITSTTGCSWDGTTACDASCNAFGCYGSLSTECCHPSCFTCIGPLFSDCTSCVGSMAPDLSCCHSTCSTCSAGTRQDCLTCFSEDFLHVSDSHCSTCSSSNGVYSVGTECFECDSSCATCSSGTSTDCLSCPSGSYLYSSDNHCGACSSDSGFFPSSGDCFPCGSTCLTCFDSSLNGCLSCFNPDFIHPSDHHCGTCSSSPNYFASSNECLACNSNCNGCTGSGNTDCIECLSTSFNHSYDGSCRSTCSSTSLFLIENSNECVQECPSNLYAIDATSQCTSCDFNVCYQCNSKNLCIECLSGFFLDNGKCYTSCPVGTVPVTSNGVRLCSDCSTGCEVCESSSPFDCILCEVGFYLYEGDCSTSCPGDTYKDNTERSCVECSLEDCYLCPETVEWTDPSSCVLCESIRGLDFTSDACSDYCGDGRRFREKDVVGLAKYFECDDGNKKDGDGCSSKCKVESGYDCKGGNPLEADMCTLIASSSSSDAISDEGSEFYGSFLYQSNDGRTLQVLFSKEPASPSVILEKTWIEINTFDPANYTVKMETKDSKVLEIQLSFNESHRDSVLSVNFDDRLTILDTDGFPLLTSVIYFELPVIYAISDSELDSYDILNQGSFAFYTVFISTGGALALVSVTNSLFGQSSTKTVLWSLAYMFENMVYYTLVNVSYPENLQIFLKNFVVAESPLVNQVFGLLRSALNSETEFTVGSYYSSQEEASRLLEESDLEIQEPAASEKRDEVFESHPESKEAIRGFKKFSRKLSKGQIQNEFKQNQRERIWAGEERRDKRLLLFGLSNPNSYYDYQIEIEVVENCYLFLIIVMAQTFLYIFSAILSKICCLDKKKTEKKSGCIGRIVKKTKKHLEFGTFINTLRADLIGVLLFSMVNLKYGGFNSIYNAINYLLSVIILVLLLIFLVKIILVLKKQSYETITEGSFAELVSDFRSIKSCKYFLVIEFVRGVLLALAFALVYEYPIFQAFVVCFTNIFFLVILFVFRPFSKKAVAFREYFINFGFTLASILVFLLVFDEKLDFLEISMRFSLGLVMIILFSSMLTFGFFLMIWDFAKTIFLLVSSILRKKRERASKKAKEAPQPISKSERDWKEEPEGVKLETNPRMFDTEEVIRDRVEYDGSGRRSMSPFRLDEISSIKSETSFFTTFSSSRNNVIRIIDQNDMTQVSIKK